MAAGLRHASPGRSALCRSAPSDQDCDTRSDHGSGRVSRHLGNYERVQSPLFDLSGKVAVITGGNGGIGLGMARGLCEAGASVAVVGRDADKCAAAAAELSSAGTAIAVPADVTDPDGVTGMVEHVVAGLGRVDILINNAGINIRKPPDELELAEWDQVLHTNLTSVFLCSRAVYPLMKTAGGGKIINIGSMMSILAAAFAPAYGASKGGLMQFTRSCAVAWAPDNIQVNAILPGWVDTDLTATARDQVDGLHDQVLHRTPAGRWGVPADFAGIAVFLGSAASDYLTGTAIPVDGGYSVVG